MVEEMENYTNKKKNGIINRRYHMKCHAKPSKNVQNYSNFKFDKDIHTEHKRHMMNGFIL